MRKLTDTKIRAIKPTDKMMKFAVGDSLYLMVPPPGSKWWRLDYRFEGRQQTLSLGLYDKLDLEAARREATEQRGLRGQPVVANALRRRASALNS